MKEKHAKFHDLQVLPKKALECTEYIPQTPRTFLIAQKWVWKTGVGGKKGCKFDSNINLRYRSSSFSFGVMLIVSSFRHLGFPSFLPLSPLYIFSIYINIHNLLLLLSVSYFSSSLHSFPTLSRTLNPPKSQSFAWRPRWFTVPLSRL